MDYCLGEPDGSATMWTVDGGPEVGGIDVDRDGLLDDMLLDTDGDGVADEALLDVDDDGAAELSVTDDGTGTWALGADRAGGLRWFGLDGLEHLGTDVADLDGDGTAERLADADGDGLADRAFGAGSAWVDTDGDGRWDLR
ncbi:MAG: pullulanase, partial [Mycobacterium sp.]|nr:pullulanase [Mycobacterium sp.]